MAPPTSIDLPAIKKLSWTTTSSYSVSDIIAYNLALGAPATDLSLVYESHPAFHPLPTFGAVHGIAVMGPVHRAMSDFLPNFQGHNHVHAHHSLRLARAYPLPAPGSPPARLTTTARVVDVVARGPSAVLVVVAIASVDAASGALVCENEWTGFVRGVPSAGASTAERATSSTVRAVPARAPDAVRVHRTSAAQGALYRAASGDLNPLHIDPATATQAGFPAPILTGTCTLGVGVRHVVEAFGGEDGAEAFRSVRVRLTRPVFAALGEEVRTEMWAEKGGRRVLFRMVVDEGEGRERVVMSDGYVELKEEGAKL